MLYWHDFFLRDPNSRSWFAAFPRSRRVKKMEDEAQDANQLPVWFGVLRCAVVCCQGGHSQKENPRLLDTHCVWYRREISWPAGHVWDHAGTDHAEWMQFHNRSNSYYPKIDPQQRMRLTGTLSVEFPGKNARPNTYRHTCTYTMINTNICLYTHEGGDRGWAMEWQKKVGGVVGGGGNKKSTIFPITNCRIVKFVTSMHASESGQVKRGCCLDRRGPTVIHAPPSGISFFFLF